MNTLELLLWFETMTRCLFVESKDMSIISPCEMQTCFNVLADIISDAVTINSPSSLYILYNRPYSELITINSI